LKRVRIQPDLLKAIRAMPPAERRAVGERIAQTQRHLGQPHRHRGIGLRKLRDDWYEIRFGLKLRLVFENTPNALVFEFMGDRDDVKRFLKNL
jgi:mRNA-degrading endonuclease RelE of RelBE toxin-antitoxin system